MTRVFKTRHFSRWMRKTELTDQVLCAVVVEMTQGLVDADLGGAVSSKSALALRAVVSVAAQEC